MPTDAEWEWVARYEGGGRLKRYPWGDALPVGARSGNYADYSARLIIQDVIPNYDDGYAASAPVGKFPPNALGIYDMGGNVAEWVHDFYAVSSRRAADGCRSAWARQRASRTVCVGRAGGNPVSTDLRLSARDFGDAARNDLGFRVARYVE